MQSTQGCFPATQARKLSRVSLCSTSNQTSPQAPAFPCLALLSLRDLPRRSRSLTIDQFRRVVLAPRGLSSTRLAMCWHQIRSELHCSCPHRDRVPTLKLTALECFAEAITASLTFSITIYEYILRSEIRGRSRSVLDRRLEIVAKPMRSIDVLVGD